MTATIRKTIRLLEAVLVLLYLFFEEIVWETFARPVKDFMEKRIRPKLESFIERSNRYLILSLFLFVLAGAEGLGFAAGYLILLSYPLLGLAAYVAKIFLAGAAFWTLTVAKEKLYSIGWFKAGYEKVLAVKEWIETREIYRATRERIGTIRKRLREWAERNGESETVKIYRRLKSLFGRRPSFVLYKKDENGSVIGLTGYLNEYGKDMSEYPFVVIENGIRRPVKGSEINVVYFLDPELVKRGGRN